MDYDEYTIPVKFRDNRLTMQAGIGTHMDSPAHCVRGGSTINEIPVEQLITSCVVIDISKQADEKYLLTAEDVKTFEKQYRKIAENTLVLIYTGWERFWSQPEKYRNNLVFPGVSAEAADLLLTRNIVGLGIDTLSPDAGDQNFPVHQLILGAGKYIIENVANAKQLSPVGTRVIAAPLKMKDVTESPIRLIAF
jgi:kynurenine formamidase